MPKSAVRAAQRASKKIKTKANVCIVESLRFLEESIHKEGEIIFRTLQLSGKKPAYTYLRSREEFEWFAREFGKSPYRYLHISCHGFTGTFWTTLGKIPSTEMVDILSPHLKDRRLFVPACLAADNKFALELMEKSECRSVLGPAGSPYFDDAAIFWTSFYHLMFKENPDSMNSEDIARNVEKCAKLVDETFNFFYRKDGKVAERTIPE